MEIQFTSLPVAAPLRITSKFGLRNTGLSGASTYHLGLDLGRDFTKSQTCILAVADGTVEKIYWSDVRGWVIILNHKSFQTLYQHLLQKPSLKKGASIKSGSIIGIMGATTKTIKDMALHLHFELHINGIPVNPEPYLKKVVNTKKESDKVNIMKRYEKIEELPKTLQSEIKSLVVCGALTGVSKENLDITEDMARVLIVSKRYADKLYSR